MKKTKNSRIINIYLIRHGEAAQSWAESSDSPLSELGKQQADVVSYSFPESPLSVVSSPMLRAQQTAIPLARKWNADVQIDDRFREIPSDEEETNRRLWLDEIFKKKWDAVNRKLWDWREQAFQALLQKKVDTVIFTHFMLINAVLSKINEQDDLVVFQPDNTSVTHLQITNRRKIGVVALGNEKKTVVN